MLNSYPQSTGDVELRLKTLEAALKEIPENAIVEAAMAFIRGEVNGHNADFAPSVPKFVEKAREMDALATHKKWLDANRASLKPYDEPFSRSVMPSNAWIVTIDQYRANYKEKLKTRPDLKYVDSIREDFQAATGRSLNIPSPAVSA